ncbi:ORF1 protein [Gallid alphaherpesvirus 3]|uniref:ORF1 protein n=1 Tax=Gallid alphaherpesvirus 3 TaxID=35250 RepID=F8TC93_9ALPH|nr:ORF1 protein [Gallid alphaherpesvirus 3]YP_010795695.1 ORF1 protein [Gallid alphaherpesvirus 3]AEI00287.1 ORF1 protein [Gallid alphaherpesvirus 3]AEI00304.1 ORF1 protein [Gallid alphaherpesvirus 3]QEY02307.1 ORF1 protein [Gallid alphaherpesvirus 3]QEY02308.1 ORF1 protein [Gallid alphaherpesvirus 3]
MSEQWGKRAPVQPWRRRQHWRSAPYRGVNAGVNRADGDQRRERGRSPALKKMRGNREKAFPAVRIASCPPPNTTTTPPLHTPQPRLRQCRPGYSFNH